MLNKATKIAILNWLQKYQIPCLFTVAVLIWFFAVKDFFIGTLSLRDDANIYKEQALYYAYHLSHGTFPLWNDLWSLGANNNFFLQRMGAFNPFYSIIMLALKLGIAPNTSYFIFLFSYHILSLIGFYLLCRELIKDKIIAFFGFLIALFSVLSLNLFITYTHLLFCPMVWFFYLLIRFSKQPSLVSFLGLTLCISTLITTYIPFYFIIAFGSFIIFWLIFYRSDIKVVFNKYKQFARKYWIIVILCLVIITASFLPGLLLKTAGDKNDFIMPLRQYNKFAVSTFAVEINNAKQFDSLAELYFSEQFGQFKDAQLRYNFLPLAFFLIFLLGIISPIQRLNLFLFVWGLLLLIISSPNLIPAFYDLLFQFGFFFRYMRMIHFFMWIIIIPAAIIFVLHQFKNLLNTQLNTKAQKILFNGYLVFIHALFLFFIIYKGADIISAYITVAYSFLCLYFFFIKKQKYSLWLFALIFLIQPLEVIHHIKKNTKELNQSSLPPVNYKPQLIQKYITISDYYTHKPPLALSQNISTDIFNSYAQNAFVVYDNIKKITPQNFQWFDLENAFKNNLNLAFVSDPNNLLTEHLPSNAPSSKALVIKEETAEFKILKWTPTHIRLETNFAKEKFLVFNDAIYRDWFAFVNKHPTPISASNIAFKGIRLPAGKNVVEFKFGKISNWILMISLLISHYCLLIAIIGLVLKNRKAPLTYETRS